MKKTLCVLLVLAALLCTGACQFAKEGPEENVEQLSDGSYLITQVGESGGVSIDEDEKTDAATGTYFQMMGRDAEEVKLYVLINKEGILEQESLSQQTANHTIPVVRILTDGTLKLVRVDRNGNPIPYTKTATKISRYYSADGKLQWTMAVTATFTYDGFSVSCTDICAETTVADNGWYVVEESCGSEEAAYDVTFGRVTLGVTTSAPEFNLALHCDEFGNLS